MIMIFPGMDPYLERPQIWTGFHASLLVYIRNYLQPRIRPRYIAAVEDRVFVEGPNREISPDIWIRKTRANDNLGSGVALADPDIPNVVRVPELEIHEAYVNILDMQSGQKVVTTLEVVSPTNKYAGPGRDLYLTKQREVRNSPTHLVEIDLLRNGPHVLAVSEAVARSEGAYNYLVCVNRSVGLRDEFELYPSVLRQRLPRLRVPLAGHDPDVVLDLQAVVAEAYEDGCYRERLQYDAPCKPPLNSEDQAWADELIRAAARSMYEGV